MSPLFRKHKRPDFFYCHHCGKEINRRDKRATREHEALTKLPGHKQGQYRKRA